jgi:hypothetical protein
MFQANFMPRDTLRHGLGSSVPVARHPMEVLQAEVCFIPCSWRSERTSTHRRYVLCRACRARWVEINDDVTCSDSCTGLASFCASRWTGPFCRRSALNCRYPAHFVAVAPPARFAAAGRQHWIIALFFSMCSFIVSPPFVVLSLRLTS